jgi:filamentous hemagglutinin family protein
MPARTATSSSPPCRAARRRRELRRPSRLLALLLSSLVASLAAAQVLPPAATALPVGGQVVVGAGQINRNGAQMVIDQSSARLGIDWQRFDIGSAASVEFRQPGASAIALNRVVGNDASAIYGRLSANGQVFLINPNGVLFAPGAKVDVGALVASTLDLSQQDFAAGRMALREVGGGASVVNQGTLAAAPGGYLALFGREVENDGQMTVRAGSVLLASGRAATVAISGNGLLSAVVAPGAAGSVDNRGLVDAPGSTVTMTARSAEGVAASLVNNRGIVRAASILERNGEIVLAGDDVASSGTISADGAGGLSGGSISVVGHKTRGRLDLAGTLSARADSGAGQGGQIETSAAQVVIADSTRVDTRSASGRHGTWTIDPTDFAVSAGGAARSTSGIGADTLAANLGSTSVTLTTDSSGSQPGDINVNAAVAWSANTTLTLDAAHDVNVNANLTATGSTAGLVLSPGSGGAYHLNNGATITLSGSAPTLTIAGTSYAVINSLAALQAIDGNAAALSANYALGSDIDGSGSASLNGGQGFSPIGNENIGQAFSGRFEGLGHSIGSLTISRPNADYVGLFAATNGATIRNLVLSGGSVAGSRFVGGVVGYADQATRVTNVASGMSVTAIDDSNSGVYAGGLVGYMPNGNASISASSSTGAVHGESPTGTGYVGGIVGYASGAIGNVGASGDVSFLYTQSTGRAGYAGGVAGFYNAASGLDHASASGNVGGAYYAGGLVGQFGNNGSITNSRADGQVSGSYYVGGLVGYASGSGGISDSVATGRVSGPSDGYIGGLVGFASLAAGLARVQAGGAVSGGSYAGGLVGQLANGAIDHGSASGKVSGGTYVGGLVGYDNGGGSISNSSASGDVQGSYMVGGLAGYLTAPVSGSSSTGNVIATSDSTVYAGGLVGYFGCYYCGNSNSAVSNSSTSGAVSVDSGGGYVGGLVGFVESGSIDHASASGKVSATDSANPASSGGSHSTGGLVGYFGYYSNSGSISNSSASGAVAGRYYTGGLVGQFYGTSISDSSASGAVSGSYYVGGLLGYGAAYGGIGNVSASGNVSSTLGSGYSASTGGLFGYLDLEGGTLTNGFASGNVSNASSSGSAGGLAGYVYLGYSGGTAINDSAAVGNVSGGQMSGGLVGQLYNYYGNGALLNSHASGNVAGGQYAGGLVGYYYRVGAGASADDIANSFATGNVSGTGYVGGLAGYFLGAKGIRGSYASGDVTGLGNSGSNYLGGLVGDFYAYAPTSSSSPGAIRASYASGDVGLASAAALGNFAAVYAGGLVGYLEGSSSSSGGPAIADAYATGKVGLDNPRGTLYAGGLVGFDSNQSIARTYASGAVSAANGNTHASGGLVAQRNSGSVSASYWDGDTTGQSGSAGGGTVLTHAQMLQSSSFAGWPIRNSASDNGETWRSYDGFTAPLLTGFLTPLSLSLADASKTYDGTTSFGNAALAGGAVTHPERIFTSVASPDVGTYVVGANGVYSVQNGYDLAVTGSAQLTITKKTITLDGVVADKVYDSTRNASFVAAAQPSGLVAGEDLVVDSSGATARFDTKNVGQNKTVSISGLTLADGAHGKASNYALANSTTTTASIAPAPLTVGGFTATDRVYDGSTTVAVTVAPSGSVSGKFAGDDVSVDVSTVTSGTLADKNVGTGKAVTVLGLGAALTGADAGNYRIAGADTVAVDIAPKSLTINGIVGNDRTYNASTTVSVSTSGATLSGAVPGDGVQLAGSSVNGTMADKNVAFDPSGNPAAKAVTVSGSAFKLRGTDALNYAVQDASTTAKISPYGVYVYAYRNNQTDKVYDGTPGANVNVAWYYAPYSGDQVGFTNNPAAYSDKNVAYDSNQRPTSKTITVDGITLSGSDAGNYVLSNPKNGAGSYTTTTSGTISPKPLTVSGVAAVDRTYDGTRNVAVNVGSATVDASAVVAGDDVGVTLPGSGTVTGTMADKNAGTNKPVTVPGFALTGTDAGNYTLGGSGAGVTVNIAKKDLSATYTGVDKVYNGNANASVSVSSGDVVSGDTVYFYADQGYCSGCYTFFATPGSTPSSYTASRDVGAGKTVVVTYNALYGSDAGNYNLLNPTGTTAASITPKPVTLAFNGVGKVYDGTDAATVTLNIGASGIYAVDAGALSVADSAVFTGGKNVGTGKAIAVSNITLSGASAGNYTLQSTTGSASADITKKPVTLSGVTATDRAYDGTTTVAVAATGTLGAAGLISGDDVQVTPPVGGLSSGTVETKQVGSAKPVTVTGLSLSGADAGNYTLADSGVTVNITPKALTASYVGVDRPYNGGVTAQVTGSSADIVGGDAVTFSQNAVFTGIDARNAGTAKPIAITAIALGGADAGNYALTSTTASATANVTGKVIAVSYTGVDRVYDGVGDTSAQVIGSSTGLIAGDIVSFAQTAAFRGDGSAGANKTIDISAISLGGPQSGNYLLASTTATATASIAKRPIGVAGITATNRVYDGTTTVSINTAGATIDTSGVIPGDQVSVVLPAGGITTGMLDSKDAGSNRNVNVTGLALAGASAANYAVTGAAGLTVNIAPKALTASYTAADKVYDGTAAAAVTWTSADVLAADLGGLDIVASGVFDGGKNAGVNKTVTIGGAYLTGVERNNYLLQNPSATTTATISPRPLSANYHGGSKVYDGTTAAPVSGSAAFLGGDDVRLTQTAVFTDGKNVGNAKPVAVSAIALAGADAANYALNNTTAVTIANVTPKPIAIAGLTGATAVDRVYDGTRTVDVVVTTNGALAPDSADIVAGDSVTINLPSGGITTGTMADKNAGTSKHLVVDGLSLSGLDAGNYLIAATSGITVNIAQKSLTAAYAGLNKVYDGTAAASASGSSGDILGGDSVTITGRGVFTAGKNAGSGKAIAIQTAQLGGVDAGNYRLANPTGSTSADITPKAITPTYAGGSKVYDGSATAPVASTTAGFVAGDDIALAQTAVFSGGKSVAYDANGQPTAKAISVNAIALAGSDALNYTLTATSAATTGTITPKALRIDGLTGVSAVDRSYDGTTQVTVDVLTSGPVAPNPADLVAGDVVGVTAPANGVTTGTMQDKNVGTAKPVAVAGLALTGADAGNYSVTATSGVTVNITPKPLTATYAGVDKVYDGSASATVNATSTDIVAGDRVTIATTAAFTDGKNVGNAKAVAISAASLSSADAGNYTLVNPAGSTTASILPKVVSVAYAGGTRVYDGTIAAPVTPTTSGFIVGDDVALGQTAVFTGSGAKNVGTGKPVQISAVSLSGSDAGNYSLATGNLTTTASVTPRPITVDGLSDVQAVDRVYDGTRTVDVIVNATGSVGAHPGDIVSGDDVTVNAPGAGKTTGTMADKNVGSNKAVVVAGLTLSGADAANYVITAAEGVSVNITPKPLTVTWGGANKVYDGTAAATLTGSSLDLVAGDSVSFAASGSFVAGKNVGIGKAVAFSDGTSSGADAANYTLTNASGTAVADITPRNLSASFTGGTKVYDGTTTAPVALASSSGLIAGDDVQVAATAVFSGAGAKNVGNGKPVQINDIALSGTDAPNYNLLSSTATTTASITPKPVTVGGLDGITATDRVYDGTTQVAITITGSGSAAPTTSDFVAGDDVAIGGSVAGQTTGVMQDKAVGQNKPVTVSGLTLTGADAANYRIAGIDGVTVTITPLALQLTGLKPIDRTYDGTLGVAIDSAAAVLSGAIVGDSVQVASSGFSGQMTDKNAGQGKPVQLGTVSLTGADAGNYTVSTGDLRVNIDPRVLNVQASVADRTYDGTTQAQVSFADDRVAGDLLSLGSAGAAFADKNAGQGKSVAVSGLNLAGSDAGNYSLARSSLSVQGNILPAPLTITATDQTKVYGDALVLPANGFSATGLVGGETIGSVALTSAGTPATAWAGSYAITASGAAGGSFDPANYVLAYQDGQLVVTPRPLVIAANTIVRYAGDPAPLTPGFSTNVGGLVNGDLVTAVAVSVPPEYAQAVGGSVFALTPSSAAFGSSGSNYAVTYQDGWLVVLPQPPALGQAAASADSGGNQVFVVSVSPEDLAHALQALDNASAVAAQSQPTAPRARPAPKPSSGSAPPVVADDSQRAQPVSLPDLLGQPLIRLDPKLRRLVFGVE